MKHTPPDADRSDALVVTWRPVDRHHRRVRFEPLDSGRWLRVEERHAQEDTWQTVGREVVTRVAVENAEVVADG